MSKDEALKMAIQWLESPWNAPDIREKVINACKEALASNSEALEKCDGCGMRYCECGERHD
jgi:hypothetical protein